MVGLQYGSFCYLFTPHFFTGLTVVLRLPYLRDIDEAHLYMQIHHHSTLRPLDSESDSDDDDEVEGRAEERRCAVTHSTLDRLKLTTPVSGFSDAKMH